MNATKKSIKGCRTFDDILNVEYGPEGTPKRDQFECDAEAFILAERLKEERLKAGLTQEEFAMRAGLGLRFVRELEQGKETVRLDKVNQALSMFGAEAVPAAKRKQEDDV